MREAKKEGDTTLEGICIVCDDCADDRKSMDSSVLASLFTRGRHSAETTVLMFQKYNLLSKINNVNVTALFVFRMRNNKDLEAVLEDNSAMADKNIAGGIQFGHQGAISILVYRPYQVSTQ